MIPENVKAGSYWVGLHEQREGSSTAGYGIQSSKSTFDAVEPQKIEVPSEKALST